MNRDEVIDCVKAARGGEEAALQRLIEVFYPDVMRVVHKKGGLDHINLGSIVVGAIERAVQTFDWVANPTTSFSTHATNIAIYATCNFFRKERKHWGCNLDRVSLQRDDAEVDTETPSLLWTVLEEMTGAGGRLAKDADLIRRRFGLDCEPATFAELSVHLGVSEQAVHQSFPAMLKRFRRLLVSRYPRHFTTA